MKFETPIAEIELFELKDIISTSESSEPTDDTTDYDTLHEGNCIYHDSRDNDSWNDCM